MFRMIGARKSKTAAALLISAAFASLSATTCFAEQQNDEPSQYESYFGDEVSAASCDEKCAEEWTLKRHYICVLTMNDLNYGYVPLDCEV